ncbi:MAG: transporter substrate-binding domain-containing protein [Polyangiaceae bacterium]
MFRGHWPRVFALVLVTLTLAPGAWADAGAADADASPDAAPDGGVALDAGPGTAPAPLPKEKLIVGTAPIAPFIVKRENGDWTGISIELWKRVAQKVGVDYEIREFDRATWRDRAHKEVDVWVSMNITAPGEEKFDLSHAFFSTGLSLAVRKESKGGAAVLWEALTSSAFLKLFAVVTLVLLAMGLVMWLIERRRNEAEFGGAGGLLHGFFWATETFIGYNDPQHKTRLGRSLGIAWAIVSVLALSGLTAEMSSLLTTSRLSTAVTGPKDLPRVKVGTVDRSQGAKWLAARGMSAAKTYASPEAMVQGLAAGEVEAVVFEAPILKYHVKQKYEQTLTVLPGTFDNHGYGIGLRADALPLRKDINLALLEVSQSGEFELLLGEWLGADGN